MSLLLILSAVIILLIAFVASIFSAVSNGKEKQLPHVPFLEEDEDELGGTNEEGEASDELEFG